MALIEIQWDPGARELRQFATLFLLFVGGLTTYFFWGAWTGWLPISLYAVAGVVGVVGWIKPPAIRPVFIGLTLAALPIGYVVSWGLMLFIYFVVLTPIGLILRATGKDFMTRTLDKEADSYWVERPPAAEARRYFQQY